MPFHWVFTCVAATNIPPGYCWVGYWTPLYKEAFIAFYSTKSNEGEVLYQLVKSAITELNLDHKNIVGKAFDGAANMNGVHKGLSTRMEESTVTDMCPTSPFRIL